MEKTFPKIAVIAALGACHDPESQDRHHNNAFPPGRDGVHLVGCMKNKKGMVRTQYCVYWLQCDRAEDCFNGAYCPVYKFNLECKTKEETSYDDPDKN